MTNSASDLARKWLADAANATDPIARLGAATIAATYAQMASSERMEVLIERVTLQQDRQWRVRRDDRDAERQMFPPSVRPIHRGPFDQA